MREPGASPVDRLGCTDCERIHDGRIAQPVNTATSLAFVVAAGIVAARRRTRADHRGQQVAFAALLALVGAGSVAFHGPQPPGSRALHDAPIVGLLGLTAALPLARAARGHAPWPGASRRRLLALSTVTAAAVSAYAGGRTSARTCDPDSLLQLHGLWHVLAAAGFVGVADVLFDEGATG